MNENLSEKIVQQIHYCNNLLHRGHHKHRKNMGKHGMGRGQVMVLITLLENNGLTQTELAEKLKIRPASLGELVDKLEQSGYVERLQNENDKRSLKVYITLDGRNYVNEIVKQKQEEEGEDLCSELSEEEKFQLSELLQKIIVSMEEKRSSNPEEFDEMGEHCCHHHCGRHGHHKDHIDHEHHGHHKKHGHHGHHKHN